ncbi:BTAD domain-containing putative transcriptional regulator [Streptomyces sp. NPDC093586]|uniref:AfsR/SARP family transcriptional regulator n=1 Tax=Streptomyces sp. NPDC093586 TaxID=3366042 RepID=UPI00381F3E43
MDFRVLGPVEAHRGGLRIPLSGSKVHTVLAALLLAKGRVVSDSRLNFLLWGWEPPATSGAQIYTYMSRLRKLLGDEVCIERRPPGYLLQAPHSAVDLLEFERLDRLGRAALAQGRHREAGALLAEALGHWRGTALANVTEHLADAELPQLEEARMHALESRIEADLALGRHEQLTAELTGLVARHPLREKLRAQLMTALYRGGRQSDALQSYYEGRTLLADQLGIDPGEALDSTYAAVLKGIQGPGPGGATRPAREPAAGFAAPTTLPPDVDELIGRDGETRVLRTQLAESAAGRGPRHLLITGMAGVGKTALAVHVAHAAPEDFPDGRLFAELSEADGRPRRPQDVLARILRDLGEPLEETDATPAVPGARADRRQCEDLVRLLRARTTGRRLLVVLDGAAEGRLLDPLLAGLPDVVVLITGRTRLTQVTGARTTALAPLGDPAALDLLAATTGRSRLLAEPDATDDLLGYCGGLPLALRIVGSRLTARPFWPVARLAQRMAAPGNRLRELSHGGLDVAAALLPSLYALSSPARAVLARLADIGTEPFPAHRAAGPLGMTEATAEQWLEQLVDGALLDLCGVDLRGRPLYRFHELVLLFAAARPAPPRTHPRSPAAR